MVETLLRAPPQAARSCRLPLRQRAEPDVRCLTSPPRRTHDTAATNGSRSRRSTGPIVPAGRQRLGIRAISGSADATGEAMRHWSLWPVRHIRGGSRAHLRRPALPRRRLRRRRYRRGRPHRLPRHGRAPRRSPRALAWAGRHRGRRSTYRVRRLPPVVDARAR